jgi:nucleotide-binding universal stress UspA family protein
MFENVFIGVDDLEGGRDALGLACQLASPHGRLTLAYVQVAMAGPDDDSGAQSLAAERLPAIERLRALRDQSHAEPQVLAVQASSVATGLHELARRRDADLLVVGASRRDSYERTFVRDDTHAVLQNPPCAVAVAPLGYATRPPGLKRVGAAYDGSQHSAQALASAKAIAREHNARVSAFEAVRDPVLLNDPWYPEREIAEHVEQARRRIAERGDVEAYAAASDDAAEALARYGASVDLLVLGAHAYRPADHFRSGTTAQRLAADAPCALLVLARG